MVRVQCNNMFYGKYKTAITTTPTLCPFFVGMSQSVLRGITPPPLPFKNISPSFSTSPLLNFQIVRAHPIFKQFPSIFWFCLVNPHNIKTFYP